MLMDSNNDTRIVIYDLTGDKQVLKSYNNKDEFEKDNFNKENDNNENKDANKILLNNSDGSKISTIDDVIELLKASGNYIIADIAQPNVNSNDSLYQKKQCIVFSANKNFTEHEFFIKCDDRCYLKFKLPLIFDTKNKILYHPHTNQKITAGFSIPKKNTFCLSI